MQRQQKRPFRRFDKKEGPIPFDVLFRRFKKKVERSGLLKDLRKKEFFESRGEKERRKRKEGARRWAKINARENFNPNDYRKRPKRG